MNSLFDIFTVCCSNPNSSPTKSNRKFSDRKKDEAFNSMEETFSTDNIKNASSGNSNQIKYSLEKEKEILSPKFNDDIVEVRKEPFPYTYTKESKKNDGSSQKMSEFTFYKEKDNSISGSYIADSDSSRIRNLSSYPNNIILDHEVKNAKKLVLRDEVGELLSGKTLYITAAGLEGGLRGKKDGYTFFGDKAKENDTVVNDFVLNNKVEGNHPTTIFYIVFKRISQKYYIKSNENSSLNDKLLIYLKLEQRLEIKSKRFFYTGDLLFYVEPFSTAPLDFSVKVELYSERIKDVYEFKSSESPITIGRKGCKINLKSTIFSKNQCTIYFESNKWFITDGYGEKRSTNGTWSLLDKKFEINSNTSLKFNSNIISILVKD